ncbi:ATP synthase j chain-domain-containing protein [Pyronema omphalodes]|nr:ATP synthase j chain-domain-containing protein [Pyronema omphalodes]
MIAAGLGPNSNIETAASLPTSTTPFRRPSAKPTHVVHPNNIPVKMSTMDKLFGKKFNTPILRPMAPFFIAGVVVAYGINSFANLLASTDEFKNDPRNPAAKKNAGH